MALISNGIDKLRAFELPGGIWSDGEAVAVPRLALVKWRSVLNDKFYQVYVNGRYAGATVDSAQRQIVVQVPTSPETAARIEVFAVEASEVSNDFSDGVSPTVAESGRVKMSFLREQSLPVNSTIQIYSNNGSGGIDYNTAITDKPIKVWPVWQDKAGFGMSCFGVSDFGFDSAAAVGFGKGSFGQSQFGLDADTFEWLSGSLQIGAYRFGAKVTDEVGNESSATETDEITVIPAAEPAEQLSVSSFNKQTNQLVLSVL